MNRKYELNETLVLPTNTFHLNVSEYSEDSTQKSKNLNDKIDLFSIHKIRVFCRIKIWLRGRKSTREMSKIKMSTLNGLFALGRNDVRNAEFISAFNSKWEQNVEIQFSGFFDHLLL